MTGNHDEVRERAEEQQMEAILTELGGLGPDPALVRRILAGADADRREATALARPTWPRQWLVAAAVMVGVGVVAAVAWLRSEDVDRAVAAPPGETAQPDQTAAR